MHPWVRGRTLNVSIALATLGLEILRRASITSASVGLTASPSDRSPSPLDQELAQRLRGLAHLPEVGVHVERFLEVGEGQRGLAELQVDHAVAGERAEVVGVAFHHLVAVGQRLRGLAEQVPDRGALVPALGEVRAALDDLREGLWPRLPPPRAPPPAARPRG